MLFAQQETIPDPGFWLGQKARPDPIIPPHQFAHAFGIVAQEAAPRLAPLNKGAMPDMKNIQSSLNQPVNKTFAATLIGIVAIALPVYGLYDSDWKDAELNAMAILLSVFWVAMVVGFILLVLGKKGKEITSEETDKKISNEYNDFQNRLTPLWWVAGLAWVIWMGYLIWSVFTKA